MHSHGSSVVGGHKCVHFLSTKRENQLNDKVSNFLRAFASKMALTMMLSVAVAGAALNTSDVQEILDFDSWMNIFGKKYADTAERVSSWIELQSRNTSRPTGHSSA